MTHARFKQIDAIVDKLDIAPISARLRQDPVRDEVVLELSLQIGKRSNLSAEAVANMTNPVIAEWIEFSIRRMLPDVCDILAQCYVMLRAREGAKQWTGK